MEKTETGESHKLILIDLGEFKCKAIIPLPISSDIQIKELANVEIQSAVAHQLSYHIGWLKGALKHRKIILKEVTIVLPQKGYYLNLEEHLTQFYENKGIKILVLTGSMIELRYGDEEEDKRSRNDQVNAFAQMTAKNN